MKSSRQTKLKLRKGFTNAPIRYQVLMSTQFNEADKKEIGKGLIVATTPKNASKLLPVPGVRTNWQLKQVSYIGSHDVQFLSFKGLEVAVFVKRQLSEVIPDPSDPVPEGIIEHPDDVWARVDLFIKSPRQLVSAVQSDLDQIDSLKAEISSLHRIVEANGVTIKSLQGQNKALQSTRLKKKPVKK